MQLFFEKRELVSFSLVEEDHKICPEDFVETLVFCTQERNWKNIKEDVLPDGTRHGRYIQDGVKDGWSTKRKLNYKLGKLHGSFFVSFGNDFVYKCEGEFEDGVATGTFCFSKKFLWFDENKCSLFFERGKPTFFYGEGYEFPIFWEKDTLSIDGKEYRNISFSDQEIPEESVYPLLNTMHWGKVAYLVEKYTQKVYGTDEEGNRVEIHIPVFL